MCAKGKGKKLNRRGLGMNQKPEVSEIRFAEWLIPIRMHCLADANQPSIRLVAKIPTPPIDEENEEFVLFARSKRVSTIPPYASSRRRLREGATNG